MIPQSPVQYRPGTLKPVFCHHALRSIIPRAYKHFFSPPSVYTSAQVDSKLWQLFLFSLMFGSGDLSASRLPGAALPLPAYLQGLGWSKLCPQFRWQRQVLCHTCAPAPLPPPRRHRTTARLRRGSRRTGGRCAGRAQPGGLRGGGGGPARRRGRCSGPVRGQTSRRPAWPSRSGRGRRPAG